MTMEHCATCEAWAEHRRCPDCGLTGTEIAEVRRAEYDKVAMHDETLPLETRCAKCHNRRTS